MTTPVRLDVYSDVVCPWCYIGKERARLAAGLLAEGQAPLALTLRWRAYELNPELPAAGMDRDAYCERKFGSRAAADRIYARIASAAATDGLPLEPRRIARMPNTRAAHRVLAAAEPAGRQDAVMDALFRAYFVEGRDIGSRNELLAIAQGAGLEPDAVERALDDTAVEAGVARDIADAHALGVTGVPAFVYHGRLLFSGAQDPRTIALALARAVARGL